MNVTKVLWFSRHEMTEEQKTSLLEKLGNVEVTHLNGTAQNVHVPFEAELNGVAIQSKPLKEVVSDFDVIAVVLPIGMLEQLKPFCGDKPLIMALNSRVFEGGEKVVFKFQKWEQIDEIKIVKSDF